MHCHAQWLGGLTKGANRLEGLDCATTEVVSVLHDNRLGRHLVGPRIRLHQRQRSSRVEQAPRRPPGPGRDAGEDRRGTHLGTQHVSQLVGDEFLARPHVQADPQLVGHRPGRSEQARLLTKQVCDPILQRQNRRILAIDVVADLGRCHRHPHRDHRPGNRVRAQVHDSICHAESISATRKASSRLCWWFRRGSHSVS